MIDAITCIDLRLPIQPLLSGERLRFPLSVDEQTGEVLAGPRKAEDRGLVFTLTPSTVRPPLRCKLAGSLHKHRNQGLHNADDYTAADLAATLIYLATTYQIDLAQSPLSTVEFGVNIALPFPVSRVLDNLISYKNRLFNRELDKGKVSYECVTQRYVLKLYDKGLQHRHEIPGLPPNLLRVEIKVLKMAYLTRQGIGLKTLADLLDSTYYPRLGRLLVDTFNDILFDEPTVDRSQLKPRQLERYLDGRNANYWFLDDTLSTSRYNAQRQKLHRDLIAFRELLRQHRVGEDWQALIAGMLAQCWQRLTNPVEKPAPEKCYKLTDLAGLSPENRYKLTDLADESSENRYKLTDLPNSGAENRYKLTDSCPVGLSDRETVADEGQKCPELTDFERGAESGETLQINRLSIGLICNTGPHVEEPKPAPRGTLVSLPSPAPLKIAAFAGLSAPVSEPHTLPLVSEAFSGRSDSIANTPTPIPNKTPTTPLEHAPRYCTVTGVEITHQPPKTHLATAKTLERLQRHVPTLYAQIVDQFLPLPGTPTAGRWRADNVARLIRLADQSPTAPRQHLRACLLTQVDITHQRPAMTLASQQTLLQLVQDDPRTFERVSTAFLSSDEQELFLPTRCHRIAARLRQLVTES